MQDFANQCKYLHVLTSAWSMLFFSATAAIKTFSETDEFESARTSSVVRSDGKPELEEITFFWELSGSMDETFQVAVCILLWYFICSLLSSTFWHIMHFHRLYEKIYNLSLRNISCCCQSIHLLLVHVHLQVLTETAVRAESLGTLGTFILFVTAMRFQMFL